MLQRGGFLFPKFHSLFCEAAQSKPEPITCSSSNIPSWKAQAVSWSEKLHVPLQTNIWTGRAGFKGSGLPSTQRVSTIVNLVAAEKKKEARASMTSLPAVLKETLLDFSQNPCRRAFSGKNDTAHCLCTSSQVYSYHVDRCVFGVEYMRLQGWGFEINIPPECESKLRELAGEGIALPCLGTIVWALYLVKGLPGVQDL